jgi:uncharacterized protein
MRTVGRISVTPVKGFALAHPGEVELTREGVVGDRRFLLVNGAGKRLRSSLTAWPIVVSGEYDVATERLLLRFPDGSVVEDGALGSGPVREWDFHGGTVGRGRVVEGEWNDRLSSLAGHDVRLVRPEATEGLREAPVTLVSRASVARLEREADGRVDARRFRMLFDLDGCVEHEEDTWNGRCVRVGDAVLRVGGPVPRCAATTRHPESGERDLDTLRLIKGYRGVRNGEAIDFGVYATVEKAGRVRVGDAVEPL